MQPVQCGAATMAKMAPVAIEFLYVSESHQPDSARRSPLDSAAQPNARQIAATLGWMPPDGDGGDTRSDAIAGMVNLRVRT